MKFLATMALMLTFGVASVYAQPLPVNLTLSGTAAKSTVDLGNGTSASEYSLAGNGALGPFTLRVISASETSTSPSSDCSGANQLYLTVPAGVGVFRFEDGSLLKLKLTGGSDCIDFSAGEARCIRIFQVTGGTDRLQGASGNNVTLTMTVVPVVPTNPNFFAVTAKFAGTISGVGMQEP